MELNLEKWGTTNMYEAEVKKEIFKKIGELRKLEETRSAKPDSGINSSVDKNKSGISHITQEDVEFAIKIGKLLFEIDELLLDTRYWPLTGLTIGELNELNKYIKENEEVYDDPSISDTLEKHMNMEMLQLKESWKERLSHLKSLYITVHLDSKIANLYTQVTKCYVHGFFESCCVLCRAVTELVAKRYIEYKGQGNLLTGRNRSSLQPNIRMILEDLLVSKDVLSIYSKIQKKADNILHRHSEKTEQKDALESVKLSQEFIKKFPKTL